MANEIDLVVGSVAFKQITDLLVELGKVDGEIKKIGESAIKMNTALGVKNTADLTKLTAENEKLNKKIQELTGSSTVLETKLANLAAAQSKATKAATDASIAEEKLLAATNKNTVATEKKTKATLEETIAQRESTAQTTLKIKAGQEEAKTYAQLDAQHKIAVKNAQDLAVQTGRTGKAYEDAKFKANEYGKQLKVIDTDIGKHTRNVGNYSSSWNGLGNSINQLTREAPAFANSVQTGFMALSNNIPILTDELGVLIQKNKDLQKDGKPTESILKTVAGAFFSWQTAISLGVTILTVYGAKIWELVTAGTAAQKSQKALAEINATAAKDASKEIGSLDLLYRTTTNISLSIEQRKKAVDKLQELYPSYFQNIKDENILNGESKDKYLELRDAIMASARAKAISAKLEESAAGRLEKENTINTELEKSRKELIKVQKSTSDNYDIMIGGGTAGMGTEIRVTKKQQLANIYQDIKKHNQDLADLSAAALKEDSFFLKEQEKLEKKSAKLAYDRTHLKEEAKPKTDKTEDVERKAIKSVNELQKVDTLLGRINTEIERLKVEKIVANAEELPAVNFQLEMLYKLRSQLNELPVGGALPDNFVKPEQIEGVKELTKEMQNYLNSFGAEFASKAGLSETFNMLSGNIEGFGENAAVTFVAVAESAQEMFNIIAEASQASFDQEYARLDKQKETSLKFAGDSSAAKEKIDADYEKKKKEIQLREFKAKQKITIANIAIDTAQAIVSTYAQVPKYDYGVSATTLAFIIAGLGAAQIAMVATQKPPAYADGTDNHSGGLMLVNDGAGSNFQEKIILPSGKVIRPQGRNVLMDAPKGTKVLNHEQQLFEMLQSNNISMSSQQASGLTYDEMNEIFQNNFANIKTQNTIFDKNGFQSYVKNGNSITRSNSNRSQAIGISV